MIQGLLLFIKGWVKMIALDYQPISIVEDIGFNGFGKAIELQYTIPS